MVSIILFQCTHWSLETTLRFVTKLSHNFFPIWTFISSTVTLSIYLRVDRCPNMFTYCLLLNLKRQHSSGKLERKLLLHFQSEFSEFYFILRKSLRAHSGELRSLLLKKQSRHLQRLLQYVAIINDTSRNFHLIYFILLAISIF